MKREEVIERFCILSAKVGAHFQHEYPCDCFCKGSPCSDTRFHQFDEVVMFFIEEAVEQRIQKESK